MGTLRENILAADDLPREKVATDEWAPSGVPFVYVRGLTAAERDDYEQSLTERGPDGTVRAKVRQQNLRAGFVARVIVDENGERVFTDKDVDALGGKNASVIDRIWDRARELSGMGVEVNPSEGDQDG
jgi:hypothetical protein